MLVGAVVGAVVIGGSIVIYSSREAIGDAIEKSMKMRGEAELLDAQSQMECWQEPYGAFFSVPGSDDSSKENPNVGKDLTDEEKNCLGSDSTGGSGGWEPDEDGEIGNTYRSIKDAPQYPRGVRNVQNGTTRNVVRDQQLLKQLRKVDPGKQSKVYKDGSDASGRKASTYYFESQSGRVSNVKAKLYWNS